MAFRQAVLNVTLEDLRRVSACYQADKASIAVVTGPGGHRDNAAVIEGLGLCELQSDRACASGSALPILTLRPKRRTSQCPVVPHAPRYDATRLGGHDRRRFRLRQKQHDRPLGPSLPLRTGFRRRPHDSDFDLVSYSADGQPGGTGENADLHFKELALLEHVLRVREL